MAEAELAKEAKAAEKAVRIKVEADAAAKQAADKELAADAAAKQAADKELAADAAEKQAADKELAPLPVATAPLPQQLASPVPLPVVPQLEQPIGPEIPEIPSSVSSPFATAEKAAAEVAVAAEKSNVKGNGDIVQGMADAAAAAAAEMTKATEQARDELVDSLPPGTVTDPAAAATATAAAAAAAAADATPLPQQLAEPEPLPLPADPIDMAHAAQEAAKVS